MQDQFKALVVREKDDGSFSKRIETRSIATDLPDHEVLIKVKYAGLNYKDALSASGHRGVTRKYPHTPGVDAAGIVISDRSGTFKEGQEVICTSYDLGMNTPGGFAEYIAVPAGWVVPLPLGITLKESMVMGTGAFTAALALHKMEMAGQRPEMGEIVVTGATGGVGSMAVAILAKAGYNVVAASGKKDKYISLLEIGAKNCIPRQDVDDKSGKPMLKSRWAGAIDNVGGNTLSTLLKSTGKEGCVASIGLVDSPQLETTVFPFILNGVNLLGVDSADTPMTTRLKIWNKLGNEWRLENISRLQNIVKLDDIAFYMDKMLKGETVGRIVVQMD